MMFTYAIAILVAICLIVFSCMLSLTLEPRRTFKRHDRAIKRSRGAVISSPRLQDAIFALNEKYEVFWTAEVELDQKIDY
jgi:hypothetical protein